jgi:valyl-tRNA synthetase
VAYIVPLNQLSYDTVSAQLSAIESLSGKTPVKISITKAEETSLTGCAVFPVSADANVYLQVKDRIQDAAKEAEKFRAKVDEARREQVDIDAIMVELRKVQDKNVTDAMQSAESRKRDVEARLWALQETVTVFEQMKV